MSLVLFLLADQTCAVASSPHVESAPPSANATVSSNETLRKVTSSRLLFGCLDEQPNVPADPCPAVQPVSCMHPSEPVEHEKEDEGKPLPLQVMWERGGKSALVGYVAGLDLIA